MLILLKWLISALAILLAAYFIPGITVGGLWIALILVVVLGLLNITIRPILILLTLPINILSFGLFAFVINALIIWFTATFIQDFFVEGFLSALLFSLVLSLIQAVFDMILNKVFKKSRH